jgi:hypothetical protein
LGLGFGVGVALGHRVVDDARSAVAVREQDLVRVGVRVRVRVRVLIRVWVQTGYTFGRWL